MIASKKSRVFTFVFIPLTANGDFTSAFFVVSEKTVSNKEKSRVRARVEHVFGSMTNELGGITIRTIGRMRAKVQIGLFNLVYNIKRVAMLIRKGYFSFDRIIAPEIA